MLLHNFGDNMSIFQQMLLEAEEPQDAPNVEMNGLTQEGCKSEGCSKDESCCKEEAEVPFPEDKSGFDKPEESNDDSFGELKMDLPESEGLDNAIGDADQFANASDGQNTNIDLSFEDSFPEDKSGFKEDVDLAYADGEGEEVDPATIPAYPAEEDQFSPEDGEDEVATASDAAELAELDDEGLEESAVNLDSWDDLF